MSMLKPTGYVVIYQTPNGEVREPFVTFKSAKARLEAISAYGAKATLVETHEDE